MRVLLATDLSPQARFAHDLVASIDWPTGTEIELVGVMEPYPTETVGLGIDPERDVRELQGDLAAAAKTIERAGRTVSTTVLTGKPATLIVRHAADHLVDLVVVGHRGRGGVVTTLLGSVSAEVVDRAPCPVLVVRGSNHAKVLLADDGSDGAALAGDLLGQWPFFRGSELHVMSVIDVGLPIAGGADLPMLTPEWWEIYRDEMDAARRFARETVDHRVTQLSDHGHPVTTEIREGSSAHEILEVARSRGVDLIVLGTRGRTGLIRLFAGSVARHVLLHAPCSVLIARTFVQVRKKGEAGGRA